MALNLCPLTPSETRRGCRQEEEWAVGKQFQFQSVVCVGEVTLVEDEEAGWMQYGGRKPVCFDRNQFPFTEPLKSYLVWLRTIRGSYRQQIEKSKTIMSAGGPSLIVGFLVDG